MTPISGRNLAKILRRGEAVQKSPKLAVMAEGQRNHSGPNSLNRIREDPTVLKAESPKPYGRDCRIFQMTRFRLAAAKADHRRTADAAPGSI